MKKYITTDKHPELKEGIELILHQEIEDNKMDSWRPKLELTTYSLNELGIRAMLEKGYIKEIQEPKWTDDDLIEFVTKFWIADVSENVRKHFYEDALVHFKKSKS